MTSARFALLVVVVAATSWGACAKSNGVYVCSPTTCTGCCDGAGNCVAPPTEAACGAAGVSCVACANGESCTQGECVPSDCMGCVDQASLACLPGTADTACGAGGAFCAACTAGTSCAGGKCTSEACSGCRDPSGICKPGNMLTACGINGDSCVVCNGTDTCQDRHCTPPASCDPTSCPTGCCDDTDHCQMGTTITACGKSGGACAACSGMGATCTAGVCKVPCGSSNCAGCCDSTGMCVASVNATCGINGATCTGCIGTDICSNGKCITTSCKGTCPGCCNGNSCLLGNTQSQCGVSGNACVGCPTGQVCQANACHIDPASLWDFVVTSATVPKFDNPPANTEYWDSFNGLPDPYVELDLDYGQADQQIGYSDTVSNTITPDWSMTTNKGKVFAGVTASALLKSSYLEVWDADTFFDSSMGFCAFHINETNFNGGLWMFTCQPPYNSVGVSWVVYFRILPH